MVEKLVDTEQIINVVDIIADVVDSIRATNSISSFSEAGTNS